MDLKDNFTHLVGLKDQLDMKVSVKSEVYIILCCQLYSTRYTAVQIKNCLKTISVIKVAIMKSTEVLHTPFNDRLKVKYPLYFYVNYITNSLSSYTNQLKSTSVFSYEPL